MAHRVYTRCVEPKDFVFGGTEWAFVWQALAYGAVAGVIAWLVAGVAAGIFVGLNAAVWALCDRLLNGTLVCLGGDRCAIGRVAHLETKAAFDIDDDLGINLLLFPFDGCAGTQAVTADATEGSLIAEQAATRNLGLGFTGYPDPAPCGDPNGQPTAILHCEIEGPGIRDFCVGLEIAAVAVGAGLATCAVVPALCPAALVVAIIIAVLAFLISFATSSNPEPSDAYTDGSGTIRADEPAAATGDEILVQGRWVYDSGHQGWNEIHPVLVVQKLNEPPPRDAAAFASFYTRWCEAVSNASGGLTGTEQSRPDNRWTVHPALG